MNQPVNAPEEFEWISSLIDWNEKDKRIDLTVETNKANKFIISFSNYDDEIIRYTISTSGEIKSFRNEMLVIDKNDFKKINIRESEDQLILNFGVYSFAITKKKFDLRLSGDNNDFICGSNPLDVDGLGRPFVKQFGITKSESGIKINQSFHLRQDEHIFGLGEKFTRLNKVGQKIISWTQDAFGSTSERSHKNIPFMWSTKGYGLFVNNSSRINWDLGVTSCQSYSIEVEDNYYDVFIIPGKSPAKIIKNYSHLTGVAPVLPKWSFGLWISSGGTYRDQESIEKLIDGLLLNDIAADVVHIDPWWMNWRKYCDFKWNCEAFPALEKFIEKCKSLGLKICLWEHPYISIESELFNIGVEKNYFLKKPDGNVYVIDYGLSLAPRPDGNVRIADKTESWNAPVAIVDFTNPKASDWYKELHRPVLKMGVDIFKTDFGEDIPADAIFYNGETGSTMHNLYPLLYNKVVSEVTKEFVENGIVWSRAGTAGNQRYPVCWSGDPASDFESLACTIRGGLSIGMSGVPFWSHDIGGYRGIPSDVVYTRWAQFGLLSSHSRMHGDSPREPWYFNSRTLAIVREFIKIRYELFPYLYHTAMQASRTGMPVIRAMPLAFPDDLNCYDKDLQYMLGDYLLIAPVYNESGKRHVYLPEGDWINFWTNDKLTGNRNIFTESTLDKIPIFIKADSIIPKMNFSSRIPEHLCNPIIFEIYPTSEGELEFYEKEGNSKIKFSLHEELKIDFKSDISRKMIFRLITTKNFSRVVSDKKEEIELKRNITGFEIKIPGKQNNISLQVQ